MKTINLDKSFIKELKEKRTAELAACQQRISMLKQQLSNQAATELKIVGAIEQLNEMLKEEDAETV